MPTVHYQFELDYPHDGEGRRFPRLTFRLSSPRDATSFLDVEAYLGSGSERSLFNGRRGAVLGIDILSGGRIRYQSAAGGHLSATIHPVRLVHEELGAFDLEVGFTSTEIERNLLGRDFFNLVQIGFRENHLRFYVTPKP